MTTITTLQLAEAIYSDVFGDIDDKRFKDMKLTEIHDWLIHVDITGVSTQELIAEWREYDAADIEARGV